MRTSSQSAYSMKVTQLLRTLCACLLMVAFGFAAIPTGARSAQTKAEKAFADWKAAQEAVAAAKANLAKAQQALQNAMTAVAKSGGKPTAAQEAALEQGRAAVAAAEAALREAEKQELAARLALENEIAELPDGPLKDRLKRERNFPSLVTANAARPTINTAGGITTVTFHLEPGGSLAVNLPDDIRAGDTISGTVVAEPKGQTPEERAKNQNVLVGLSFIIDGKRVEPFSGSPVKEREPVIQQTFWIYTANVSGKDGNLPIAVADREGQTLAQTTILIGQMFDEIRKAGEVKTPSGPVTTPDLKLTQPTFAFPPLGQTGRRIAIPGPFDGNSSNTTLYFGPARSTVQDFEKNTENVSGGFGLIRPLAESPRKLVFESPPNVTGPMQLLLREGDAKTLAPFRNVGVNLSAPKTNLVKGERTTLTVEVSGLEGITKDVPLQLDSKGVITMDGGNFQNLRISPSEVKQDGRYTTTRAITGQQAGGFTVVATVIVDRFDVCIAGDSNRQSGILWNTFTGDYIFTNLSLPPQPGGQPPSGETITPGGTSPPAPEGTSLTGTGTLARKGCVIVLTHNAPDRRVFARLDACTKTGEATVQTRSPQANVTITDKNVTDNTCSSK